MIDAANLEQSLKSLNWRIDYLRLRRLFDGSQLTEVRYYCVHHYAQNQDAFFTFLKKNKFSIITKPLKIIKQADVERGDIRKANFDVEISVDALELQDKFDTLVLFSGDSDFAYLIGRLRRKNKRIVVVSAKYHISKELIMNSDKYFDIKKLRPYLERNKKARLLQRAVDNGFSSAPLL